MILSSDSPVGSTLLTFCLALEFYPLALTATLVSLLLLLFLSLVVFFLLLFLLSFSLFSLRVFLRFTDDVHHSRQKWIGGSSVRIVETTRT